MTTVIIAPVTIALLSQLLITEEMLAEHRASSGSGLNDAKSYAPFARQLEALTQEVLIARSSASLIDPVRPGAAFHVHSGSSVMKALDRIVPYLGGVAVNLLKNEGSALSRYDTSHTVTVVGHLAELNGCLLNDIRQVAARDLAIVATQGVVRLADAANLLGLIANGDNLTTIASQLVKNETG